MLCSRSRVLLLCGAVAACRTAVAPSLVDDVWQPVPTPTSASLRALAVVDEQVVWVGGAEGTLLRTTDGGASWQDVRPAEAAGCDFRDVHAFGADVAVVMVAGQPARLHRTEDAGRRWTVVHADERAGTFFDAIAFAGDDGVLFGDPVDGAFDVWQSRDAGRSWQVVPVARLPSPAPGEAGFAASGSCVVVVPSAAADPHALVITGGGAVRCLRVPFGAEAAGVVSLPLVHGAPSQGAFSLALRGARAVAVGGDYREPVRAAGTAAWSDDGGATWQPAATAGGGYRSAVVWLDDENVLAVGSHGTSASCDGGRTWQALVGTGFHALGVGADGSVWACGSDGRVARLRPEALRRLRRFATDLPRGPG